MRHTLLTGRNLRRITMASLFLAPWYAAVSSAQVKLRQIDSVLVRETGESYISRMGALAPGFQGDLFVADVAEGHVVRIAADGSVSGLFGRKGKGPGEFVGPSSMVVIGDSLLAYDGSQRRLTVYQISTRKFVRSVPLALPPFASLEKRGAELLVLMVDPATFTPVTVISPTGAITAREGVSPPFLKRNPMFVQTTNQSAIATRGDEMWGASEFSQTLYSWKRGATTATREIAVPVHTRRGVDEDLFLQVQRDPSKAAALFYKHSAPVTMAFITTSTLALVTMDPTFDKGQFTAAHHLTLVDVESNRVCAEVKLPIPEDPLPHLVFVGDTLVVLQQASNGTGEPATARRRFTIDARQCKWVAG